MLAPEWLQHRGNPFAYYLSVFLVECFCEMVAVEISIFNLINQKHCQRACQLDILYFRELRQLENRVGVL